MYIYGYKNRTQVGTNNKTRVIPENILYWIVIERETRAI